MAYTPIEDSKGPSTHMQDIELNTRYDAGSSNFVPTAAKPPDVNTNHVDTKGAFRSGEAPVERWPVHSERVATVTPSRIVLMMLDAALASTPIMFVALALIAAKLDGKEVSQYGYRLRDILLLSPTLFPLIFAALMGRFFRHLGLWLAERGTTLGRLEHLVGCQSVFSALETQICLRSWSVIGLLSVLVWLLSPIGGQSALRLLKQETGAIPSIATVRYLGPQAISDSVIMGAASANGGRSGFTSIFLAALLSSSKYQDTPMDLWGNVKLPIYRYIENSTSDEWKTVGNSTRGNATYASLIGIPLAGLPLDGFSNFTIKARQFDIICSSNKMVPNDTAGFGLMKGTWKLRPKTVNLSVCGDSADCAAPDCNGYPCPILSKSLANDSVSSYQYSVAECDLNLEYLEAAVRCNTTACAVHRMRKLPLFDADYTQKMDNFTRNNYLSNEMELMPSVDNWNVASASARGSTNMERWMMNPSDFIGIHYSKVQLWQLSPELFSERLTILYNTFWQSTYGTRALGGNLPRDLAQTGLLLSTSNGANITFKSAEASVIRVTPPVYKTDWKWFTALLICSLVLLAAAYIGLMLKYITLAPDIIGYASSLTLLNPYVPTPTGGTTLHGLERAALLHDMPVRIGDVCANEPVGAVAFAKDVDGRVGRLDRRRRYI